MIDELKSLFRHVAGVIYPVMGVVAAVIASQFESVYYQIAAITLIVLIGSIDYYQSIRDSRRDTRDRMRPFVENFFLPKLLQEYKDLHSDSDPPDVRANIMLLGHRDFPIPRGERKLCPWTQSLMVDFRLGEYDDDGHLKWRKGEGVCGTVIEFNKAIHSDLEEVEIYEWDMTDRQHRSTEHLGSVLSIPIYRPEDEEKNEPIGVLNVDSEKNLNDTEFGRSEIKKTLKKYASYVGRTL